MLENSYMRSSKKQEKKASNCALQENNDSCYRIKTEMQEATGQQPPEPPVPKKLQHWIDNMLSEVDQG